MHFNFFPLGFQEFRNNAHVQRKLHIIYIMFTKVIERRRSACNFNKKKKVIEYIFFFFYLCSRAILNFSTKVLKRTHNLTFTQTSYRIDAHLDLHHIRHTPVATIKKKKKHTPLKQSS